MIKESNGIDDSSGDGDGDGKGKGISNFYIYGGDYFLNCHGWGDGGSGGSGYGWGGGSGFGSNSDFIDIVNYDKRF